MEYSSSTHCGNLTINFAAAVPRVCVRQFSLWLSLAFWVYPLQSSPIWKLRAIPCYTILWGFPESVSGQFNQERLLDLASFPLDFSVILPVPLSQLSMPGCGPQCFTVAGSLPHRDCLVFFGKSHSRRSAPKWMVYKGQSHHKMDEPKHFEVANWQISLVPDFLQSFLRFIPQAQGPSPSTWHHGGNVQYIQHLADFRTI